MSATTEIWHRLADLLKARLPKRDLHDFAFTSTTCKLVAATTPRESSISSAKLPWDEVRGFERGKGSFEAMNEGLGKGKEGYEGRYESVRTDYVIPSTPSSTYSKLQSAHAQHHGNCEQSRPPNRRSSLTRSAKPAIRSLPTESRNQEKGRSRGTNEKGCEREGSQRRSVERGARVLGRSGETAHNKHTLPVPTSFHNRRRLPHPTTLDGSPIGTGAFNVHPLAPNPVTSRSPQTTFAHPYPRHSASHLRSLHTRARKS